LLTKTKPGPETNVVTVPLLQNVLVLAVGDDVDPMSEEVRSRASDSVTLLLTVDQASLLAQARQSSTLSLALRNENDLAINEGLTETDDSDILELEKRASRQRRLRIEKVD
jgi:Flp pilus assembly protein CpaB